MAQKKTQVTSAPTSTISKTEPSIEEKLQFYEQNKNKLLSFASAENALKNLRDVNKTTSFKTISNFNKESLRNYLQNVSSNEKNLRNLSRYLAYRSQTYYRLIYYNASMFCLNARSVIPNYSIIEENDKQAMLQSYNDTLNALDKMHLDFEFFKANITCFTEDAFYGVYYFDPESESNSSFFILPLDPDYCKIRGIYETGDFAFSFDCSFLRKYPELVEFWGAPFDSMYKEFEKTGVKWQPVPPEYGICLKYRANDWETVVPPFSGVLNGLLSLIDQEDISAIADRQSIYKLIWMEMETFDDGQPNNFKVDPEQVTIPYWNRMVDEALPDYATGAIIPGKLNQISFDSDQANDTSKVQKATETVLNTAGGAQILQSANISGTTAFNMAMQIDSQMAISSLLPQIEKIVNRILYLYLDNPSKVKFLEVTPATMQSYKDSILKDNTYGLAPKLLVNSLNGFSERDTLALNFLENECLNLNFVPVQSSHTTAGTADSTGNTKPTLSDTEITDDGEASRDKRDNTNG